MGEALAGALLLNLILATWAAWLADRRGRSFWVYLVVCFVIPGLWLIAVPYLLIFRRPTRRSALRAWWAGDDLRDPH